jgi:hypothetical protein
MDLSLIGAAATSPGLARDFGKAAMAVRDFNEMAAIVSKLNDQILKAQDSLFALQSELLREQQEHFETLKKVRERNKLSMTAVNTALLSRCAATLCLQGEEG